MALVNYDMDFRKMVSQVLGALHRTKKSDGTEAVKRIGWLAAMLKPNRMLHDTFLAFFNQKKYELKWTGQTIILEHLLIEKFGAGIYITNYSNTYDQFFVGEGDDIDSFWGDSFDVSKYFGEEADVVVNQFSFTVNVPASITFTESEMIALITKYKRYGTTFNIVIV